MDFESSPVDARVYIPFIRGAATQGGPWATPIAQNAWAPSIVLCTKAVTGSNTSYIYFYDCAIADPTIVLPDGGTIIATSQGSESTRPPQPNSDGDINDPDLQVNTPGSIEGPLGPPPSNSSSGGTHIPGWGIFLIVLACIVVVAVIILIIFLLFGASGQSERF